MKPASRYLYWCFKNLYTPKEIKILNKKIQRNLTNSVKDTPATYVVKTAKVKLVNPQKIPELNRTFESMHDANRQNFGFNLYSSINDKQTVLNYNIYDAKSKGEYAYHADFQYDHAVSDIKLTGLLNLSMESYEGGDLYINPFGREVLISELSQSGTLIVFPSWFLHKVAPITKGKRRSLALWAKGPKFT
tara:strand:- start:167 stop:736 length:570 start_codon:yes stop_codon:yes gene_type:complete